MDDVGVDPFPGELHRLPVGTVLRPSEDQAALHISLLDTLQQGGMLIAVAHKEDPLFNGLEGIRLGACANAYSVYQELSCKPALAHWRWWQRRRAIGAIWLR